jgi:hypothetical protein
MVLAKYRAYEADFQMNDGSYAIHTVNGLHSLRGAPIL